jgi:hypothetical protein
MFVTERRSVIDSDLEAFSHYLAEALVLPTENPAL